MATGTIKTLVSDRGFGFIGPKEAEADAKDLFFHSADVQGVAYEDLRVGQEVDYDLGTDERGGRPKATNVRSLLST